MRKRARTSYKRTVGEAGRQLDLFELANGSEEQSSKAPAPGQEAHAVAHAVDLKGANEYGLPTQMPLPVAEGLPEREEGASEHADLANSPTDREEADDPGAGPETFLKLIARIAMRAGQKSEAMEVTDEGSSIPESE